MGWWPRMLTCWKQHHPWSLQCWHRPWRKGKPNALRSKMQPATRCHSSWRCLADVFGISRGCFVFIHSTSKWSEVLRLESPHQDIHCAANTFHHVSRMGSMYHCWLVHQDFVHLFSARRAWPPDCFARFGLGSSLASGCGGRDLDRSTGRCSSCVTLVRQFSMSVSLML